MERNPEQHTGSRAADAAAPQGLPRMELNKEQEQAASHLEGPLKVLAGPGSGKTLVIVEKVARLVASGVPQESILCMTFTEKAADEMRQRLYKEGIRNVWVGTMHALCLDMLKENAITTGITDRTVVFSEMARLAWCVRNIHSMGIDTRVVNLDRNPQGICTKMLESIRLAKRELISVDAILEYAESGEPDTSKEELAQLAKLYAAYNIHMARENIIDYEDMVASIVKRLEEDSRMLEAYSERYRYVLVDEFQDNNYAQFLLAKLLARSRNLTVVGDDDQSIMGFQGAFGGIFEEFDDAYPDAESVTLKTNYRCSPHIASLAARLLEADPARTPKRMRADAAEGRPVEVVAAADEAAERRFIAEAIPNLDAPYKDVAVLCRTNRACRKVAETLRARGVPVALVGPGSLGRNATAAEVLALLRIADSPETAGAQISHILMLRGIYEYNIRAVNAEARRYAKKNPGAPDDGVLASMVRPLGLDQDVQIREVGERLHMMAEAARSTDLLNILHDIMTTYSDAYKKSANEQTPEAARNLAILNGIYAIARDYVRHYPRERLSDFIEYLDMVDEQTLEGMQDAEAKDAVSVMTIHKSKGKEFDAVFVTGLYDDEMPGKPRRVDFEIPPSLLRGKGRERNPEAGRIREMRNLLYVAMTRAKDMLYLTYPLQAKTGSKQREPSRFLAEMRADDESVMRFGKYEEPAEAAPAAGDPLDAELWDVQERVCKAVRESRPRAAILGVVEMARVLHTINGQGGAFDPRDMLDVDAAGLGERPTRVAAPLVDPDTLTLSASSIETYQQCPLKFKYRKVLGIPEKPSVNLRKGSAAHAALEWAAKESMAGRSPDVDGMARVAKEEMETSRNMFPDSEYAKAASSMKEILEYYAEWEAGSDNTLEAAEAKFEIPIGGIRYRGKIDRVEKNPRGEYEIVDYKTGKSVKSKKKVPKLPQPNIYVAAVREKYGSLPAKFSLVYLERRASREYHVTEEALEEGLEIVRECAGDIVKERFGPTPGYHCNWCSYRGFCPAMMSE